MAEWGHREEHGMEGWVVCVCVCFLGAAHVVVGPQGPPQQAGHLRGEARQGQGGGSSNIQTIIHDSVSVCLSPVKAKAAAAGQGQGGGSSNIQTYTRLSTGISGLKFPP